MRLTKFSSSRTFPGHEWARKRSRISGERRIGLPVVLARVLLAEVLGEDGDLLGPLAERGDEDIDDVEAVVEVLAKGPLGDRLFEVLVGGGDDADVDLDVAVGAQPRELVVLEHLQELGLERQGHLADLVEEHGAAVGELELARLLPVGAGEGAALVAEELGLEQRRRQGRAVDLDACARAPDGGVVDGAGDELLADPGLAPDEDGDVGVGDLLDHLLDGLHAGTLLEEAVVIRSAALALVPEHLLPELRDLPPQRGLFLSRSRRLPARSPPLDRRRRRSTRPTRLRPHRRLDRVEQHLAVERLAQVRGDAGSPDSLGGRRIVMGGDEDHGDTGAVHRQPLLKLEPAHPAQTEVQDQAGRTGGRRCVEKLTGRRERLDGIACRLDQASEGPANRQIVVDDGDQRKVRHEVIALG